MFLESLSYKKQMFPGKYLALIPLSTVIALAEASTIHSMTQLSVK